MRASFDKNAHWLAIGLILIAAYFAGQALVSHFVPAAVFNGNLSISSTGEATFTQDSEQVTARQKAFNDAKNKAEQMASLAGKSLGKLTYISESTIPTGDGPTPYMPADMTEPAPEATSGAATKRTVSVSLNYELK